jgi:2-polyprenyl-3-methyl-5-hydroxy-6-metoxy-1,4-benzoquinol methylase
LLSEGLGLKDATPYNVLFQGTKPIFVDLASIEKREDGDAIWRPFAQFLRMFLLPLLMNREFGLGFPEVFLCYTDGLTPKYCSAFGKWWKKNIFFLVFFPKFLSRFTKSSIYQKKLLHNVELAQFILTKRFKANAKILKRLSPARMSSHWASYMSNLSHYSEESFCKKERFIKKILKEKQPEKVLDVGCNTGYFSKLAAKMKSQVVAIDYDPAVIENLYQEARKENLDILPLVVNLTRPSPSLGWRNRETWSFLDRAVQKFDLVLMLAVIHHMIVTDRIPMEEIAELAAKITKKWVVIEFVEASDPKFIELQRGRDFYKNITFEYFQKCFEKHFTFEEISSADYHPTRRLVLLQKKAPGC